jgi:ABC-type transport system involved in cytochrome c biogenesis permease subunit
MILSAFLYAFLFIAVLGFLSILVPLRFLRIRTRRAGAVVMLAGIVGVVVMAMLPVTEKRAATKATRLDDFMPVWQFSERHTIDVAAPL